MTNDYVTAKELPFPIGPRTPLPEGLHHQGLLRRGGRLVPVQRVRPVSGPAAQPVRHQHPDPNQTGTSGLEPQFH